MCEGNVFPFDNLSDLELSEEFNLIQCCTTENQNLKKLLIDSLSEDLLQKLEFKYYTPLELDNLAARFKKKTELSLFHVNIRSLNANHSKLINFFQCCKFKFDVIVLTEIWSTNIQYYSKLFNNFTFFYDLPINSKVGGVGVYVRNELISKERDDLVAASNNKKLYECKWIEIEVDKKKYFIGGYYRHPNTSVSDFSEALMLTIDKLKNKKGVSF